MRVYRSQLLLVALVAATFIHAMAGVAGAQYPPGQQGSSNIKVVSHLSLGGAQPLMPADIRPRPGATPGSLNEAIEALGTRTADITMEQELARPFAYVCHRFAPTGFWIISIKDPSKPRIIYDWNIENPDIHRGSGALGPMYVKSKGRYYFLQSFQFQQGGPDVDLGAVVFDVTGLPDTAKVKEVARIRVPELPGGFHENFTYKHSTGAALMFSTTTGPVVNVYDVDKLVAGDPKQGLVGTVPLPTESSVGSPMRGYHDMYVAFDPPSQQDRFYGAGAGGYYVYDVTDLANPKLLTSITGIAGVSWGHTFTPDPTGRYAVTETEYRLSPLRIFDLKPGLDGQVKTISRPIGAWTANWKSYAHNMEVRWPYVFVGAYDDGLHVFNMMDPTNPYTVGYYDTHDGPDGTLKQDKAFGVWSPQIRNADGLIVASDFITGFWAFKMDGFDGWNGHQWGVPNTSSAQDWDNGPDGLRKTKVS